MTLNEIKAGAFDSLAKTMTDETTYAIVKDVVSTFMDFEMEGKQKLIEVKKIVMPLFDSVKPIVTTVVIQLAYYALQALMTPKTEQRQ